MFPDLYRGRSGCLSLVVGSAGRFRKTKPTRHHYWSESINTCMTEAKKLWTPPLNRLSYAPRIQLERPESPIKDRAMRCAARFSAPARPQVIASARLRPNSVPSPVVTAPVPPPHLPQRKSRAPGRPVTFLFVGQTGVRKGLHHLLEVWRMAPANAHLRLVGTS